MISKGRAVLAVLLSSILGGHSQGAERGFPASLAGAWRMSRLACDGCSLAGVLPSDLAGGEIMITPESFDDPLTGACPGVQFSAKTPEDFAHYLAQNAAAGLGPLQRLATQDAPVIRVDVLCQPPPGARVPHGAAVSLAFVPPNTLIRAWTDRSYVILSRSPPPPPAH